MFSQVPVLPVVVPVATTTFVVLLVHLRRREMMTAPRAAVALALCVYAAGVIANTVFPIFLDKPLANARWDAHLALVPLAGYEAADAVTNIVVFAPLGMLVPLLAARLTWKRTLALAAAASLLIEVSQYVTAQLLGGGHIADVNDFLFNVLGAALGLGLLTALSRVPRISTLVDRFRWY